MPTSPASVRLALTAGVVLSVSWGCSGNSAASGPGNGGSSSSAAGSGGIIGSAVGGNAGGGEIGGTGTGGSASGVAAARVSDFLDTLGVCTHISQGVDDPKQVANALTYLGIGHIRDDGSTNAATLRKFIDLHNSAGTTVALLPINGDVAASIAEWQTLASAGALLAAEGPNEPNNWPVTYHGQTSSSTTSLPIAQFQRDLYAAVKANSQLAGLAVFHSSEAGGSEPDNVGLQFLTIPAGAGTSMPDGTTYADFANTHNYVCGHQNRLIDNVAWQATDSTLNGDWDGMFVEYHHTWWGAGFDGYSLSELPSIPKVSTETGWTTSGSGSITEEQQGRLFLNLYLSGFKHDWAYTFIYMLHDDPIQGYWGLVDPSYQPKLSGLYLHNLTTILTDTGGGTLGRLDYTIPDQPPTVHDLLLQKSNGTFELVVWDERAPGGTDVFTVNLGSTFTSVRVYDPTVGTSAVNTLSHVSSVSLTLSDHPNIIEI